MCLLLNNSMKICKIEGCNNECDKNTRYCHKHLLERKAQQRAARKAAGLKVRTTWTKQCLLCGADFEAVNKHISKYCPECWNKIKHKTLGADNNYNFKEEMGEHRFIVENLLQRKLSYNEVIHHLDGNSKNNSIDNLLLLSRSSHVSLHRYLNLEGAILENKFGTEYYEKWRSSLKVLSLAWLSSNNIEYTLATELVELK